MTLEALRSADVVVVGTGFHGLTIAEQVASRTGRRVLMIERRSHLGGNAYSHNDPETGIEVHTYGSHLFHTSNQRVVDYVANFTRFNDYQHRVYSRYQGRIYPMPINLGTITTYFERAMSPDEARALVAEQAAELGDATPSNLEEKAISLIGRPRMRRSSAATPPNNGRPIRANSTRGSSPVCRCVTRSTTATSTTPSKAFRWMATRHGLRRWPRTR